MANRRKPPGTVIPSNRETTDTGHDSILAFLRSLRPVAVLLISCVVGLLNVYHVSTMFENDRHFSHLSTLEREMTFRSEMGLYYSYYKTIVDAPTFLEGFLRLTHDNLAEYPSVINTLERFNLLPEVVLGLMYRVFDQACEYFGIDAKQCWEVERGQGLSPVYSCEGIRVPEYFYLEAVWICAGLTASFIFLYGFVLSESIIGGIIAVSSFFYNHAESTRVQWTPPLRESFAYPFCLLQMLTVTLCIKSNRLNPDAPLGFNRLQGMAITVTTSLCLSMWQFTQFLFTTQIIAVLLMFMFGFLNKTSLTIIFYGEMMAVTHTLMFMFGNELLLTSLLTCLLLTGSVMLTFVYPVVWANSESAVKNTAISCAIFAVAILLKTRALTTNDDVHIMNILRSKVSHFNDFHTLLYTCSAEFDFLGWETITRLISTCLIPMVIFVLFTLLLNWLMGSNKITAIEPHIVYNVLQLGAFTIMAVMVMRLKLFFTPQLCIIASLVASRRYLKILKSKYHYSALVALLACTYATGLSNIEEQHTIIGEYSNVALEDLLKWISERTPPTAVFAGPMPITASVLLSTRRPVVNHPHYEDAGLRERTKKVYSAFSKKTPEDVFKIISSLKTDFLILSSTWCYGHNKIGCRMTDLWDLEDEKNRDREPVCPQLMLGSFPFHLVFNNDEFAVLSLQAPYVELKGFNKF